MKKLMTDTENDYGIELICSSYKCPEAAK